MQKFDVHLFAVVRVKVVDVEAETPEEAIRKAEESVDLNDLLYQKKPCADLAGAPNVEYVEFDDSVPNALVETWPEGATERDEPLTCRHYESEKNGNTFPWRLVE